MRAVKCFLLGALAVGVLSYAMVAALAVVAQAAGRTLGLALGPLVFVSVSQAAGSTVTTFGTGLVVLSLAGGCVNLAAARLMQHRARGPGAHVD